MASPSSPRKVAAEAAAPKSRRRLYGYAAAFLAVGGLVLAYTLFYGDSVRLHEFDVAWEKDAPRGEPVRVEYAVKAGDVFVTDVVSRARFVLSVEEQYEMKSGMSLLMKYTFGQVVAEKPGGGLRSTTKVLLERADSDIPGIRDAVWLLLGNRERPVTVTVDRDPAGRPDPRTTGGDAKKAALREVFDRSLDGLGDVVTNYLPARDVRLGETWTLESVADVPRIREVVHFVARTEATAGFPPPKVRSQVSAVALEDRDGEPTLKLRLLWYMTQEGEAVPPANPGRVTTAALIDGFVWVSRTTGVLWEMDLGTRMLSSYLTAQFPTERKGEGRVTMKTRRADKMPE